MRVSSAAASAWSSALREEEAGGKLGGAFHLCCFGTGVVVWGGGDVEGSVVSLALLVVRSGDRQEGEKPGVGGGGAFHLGVQNANGGGRERATRSSFSLYL